jgi:steroid 5-alpha reductase family enzyme
MPTDALAHAALAIAAAMLALWLLSLALRDASIVDIWWGPGIALGASAAWWSAGASPQPRALLLVALAWLWALRLAGYLLWRNAGHGEDPRYQAMRRHWGARFPLISLATVFTLQGVLQWLVSLGLQLGSAQPGAAPLGAFDALGALLVALGLGFETIGDAQLARFKANPANAGRVLDRGLWRYTRHPNYFGDALAHWGLFAIAFGAPHGGLAALSPALMTFLLLCVSGVALLERSIGKRRPEYAEYQRKTSAFIPLPPRPSARSHPSSETPR